MKKLILTLANLILSSMARHEQKSRLDMINDLLSIGTIEERVDLYLKVKANMNREMDLYKNQKENEINLINRIRPIKEYDQNYDKSLSELEVNFEIVNK
jgi:hypothetical protein